MSVAESEWEPPAEESGAARAYGGFERHRTRLADLFARTEAMLEELELESRRRGLAELRGKVQSAHFKVMVLGEFKRGKSTLINALLGQRVLPAKAVPCTATINEIGWGEEARAVVHFRSPLPEQLPQGLPAEVLEHLERHPEAPPPLDIGAEELRRYVSIPDPAREQEDSVALTPYERVELSWPLDLCRNGVEIVDSPGLNEHGTRNRIVRDYLREADAVVFVSKCDVLASATEKEVIDRDLRGSGHEEIFFVCNAYDLIAAEDREEIRELGLAALGSRTSSGADGVFFVSALEALEGREKADPERVQASGLPRLEERLARFLTHDRGRTKLLQPVRRLCSATSEVLGEVIPGQRKLLDEELSVVEDRRRELEPRIEAARQEKGYILSGLESSLDLLRREVEEAAEIFLEELPEGFTEWLEEVELETEIKIATIHQKEQLQTLVEELSRKTEAWIEERTAEWEAEILGPLVEKRMEAAMRRVEESVEHLGEELDRSRAAVGLEGAETATAASRMGFALEGLAIGLVAQSVSLAFGALLLGATSFWILVPLALGAGALGFWSAEATYRDTVKKRFSQKVLEHLEENRATVVRQTAGAVVEGGRELQSRLDEALSEEVSSVQEQLDSVLEEKRAGEERAAERRKRLDGIESEVREVDAALDDLLFTLAETA